MLLSTKEIKILKYLVSLAIETRTDIMTDDTPFATLSALEAKLTQMEIYYNDKKYNQFRRSNQGKN